MDALTGLSPSYLREREPARAHFQRMDAGRAKIGVEAAQPRAMPDEPCRFDVYRAEQIRTSSTLFAGGDWRWQLSDTAGRILVEAGGYRSEDDCRTAVAMLRRHVPSALFPPTE